MGKRSRCVFDICDNDMQYPELQKKQSNVDGRYVEGIMCEGRCEGLIIHKLPKDGGVKAA